MVDTVVEKGSNRLIQSLNKTDIEKVIKCGEIAIREWKKNFLPKNLDFILLNQMDGMPFKIS
ncbi:MAG: hypothetical protein MGU50_14175 [Trichodesmium sp. MAG_R02]|nr:hypothetical protein [Trichodesmium sp. MAG_R02]MDE5117545.1 hypothetical protein [Trichodesmium sp. St2_bin2_1]